MGTLSLMYRLHDSVFFRDESILFLGGSVRDATKLMSTILLAVPFIFSAGIADAQGPLDLPVGEMTAAQMVSGDGATFRFVAETSGLLTILIHGEEIDLFIEVSDAVGQLVEDGRVDFDLFGNAGTEHFSRALRRPGEYLIRVGSFMSELGEFTIGASWLPAAAIEVPPDPDGAPDTATALVPGTPIQDTLDPSTGDGSDWYFVEATADIVLTVITEGEDDVFLEAYDADDFSNYMDRSDQDLQGSGGNESVTVRLRAGERAYFKVVPFSGSVGYSIRAGVM